MLNHEEIKKDQQRITKTQPFINKKIRKIDENSKY